MCETRETLREQKFFRNSQSKSFHKYSGQIQTFESDQLREKYLNLRQFNSAIIEK